MGRGVYFNEHRVPEEHILKAANQCTNLVRRLKSKLLTMTTAYWQGGYDRGKKISTKHLVNLTPAMRNSTAYGKVFSRKVSGYDIDTAVYVALDCSSSMDNDKFLHAAAATLALYQVLTRLAVPIRIEGFTTYNRAMDGVDTTDDPGSFDDGVEHMEVCDFNEVTADSVMAGRLSTCSTRRRNNNDAAAISAGYSHLRVRDEKRKLLIVLSDGSPADGNSAGCYAYTKQLIQAIESEKSIEIYGIGILDTAVERLYTNHIVFDDVKELELNLIRFTENNILKAN